MRIDVILDKYQLKALKQKYPTLWVKEAIMVGVLQNLGTLHPKFDTWPKKKQRRYLGQRVKYTKPIKGEQVFMALQEANKPLTGPELAQLTGVTLGQVYRQIKRNDSICKVSGGFKL